jgi:hypothetical protein
MDLPDSISKQFERKRDTAYPLFVEKHYDFARSHGLFYARMFLASLRRTLGRSAVLAGHYREARRYFALSFLANPLYRPVYVDLVASIGGRRTYESARAVRRGLATVRSELERLSGLGWRG